MLRRRLAAISIVLGVAVAGTTTAAADWGRVVNLSAPERSWNLLPTSAAIDARGNTLAVWIDAGARRVVTAYRPHGGAWRRPVAVPGSRGAQFEATVGFDGAGGAVVAWESGHRIRAVRRGAGGAWGTPVTVYRDTATDAETLGSSLNLAVNQSGRAAVSFVARSRLRVVIRSAGPLGEGVDAAEDPRGATRGGRHAHPISLADVQWRRRPGDRPLGTARP